MHRISVSEVGVGSQLIAIQKQQLMTLHWNKLGLVLLRHSVVRPNGPPQRITTHRDHIPRQLLLLLGKRASAKTQQVNKQKQMILPG